MYSILIIASLLAALLWVFIDSVSKVFIKKLGRQKSATLIVSAGIIPAAIAVAIVGLPGMGLVELAELVVAAAVAGAALFAGFATVYKSVGKAGVANSYMLVELQPPLLIIFSLVALSEHLSMLQLLSIVLIFTGVAFVAVTKNLRISRNLLPSVIGNVLWASYWIVAVTFMAYLKEYALLMLLIRVFAAVFALAYYGSRSAGGAKVRLRSKNIIPIAIIALVLIAGLADGTGNILFAFVSFNHKLAVASAILTIEPIAVWLVGVALYKEKITKFQKLGFAIATIGYIALSLA
ncbi:MAG: EamA family transporter [Candidatus Micrarchaeaceae archaeon]